MAKKEVKKTAKKKTSKAKVSKDAEKLNVVLIENFVKLQKVMTNLTLKFDSLSEQMSKLLQLFEISAKSFTEKLSVGVPDVEKDRDFLEKLDKLLDQNKVIAKGLTLMEEKMKARLLGAPRPIMQQPRPFPPQAAEQGYLPSSLEKSKRTREVE